MGHYYNLYNDNILDIMMLHILLPHYKMNSFYFLLMYLEV